MNLVSGNRTDTTCTAIRSASRDSAAIKLQIRLGGKTRLRKISPEPQLTGIEGERTSSSSLENVVLLPMERGVGLNDHALVRKRFQFLDQRRLASLQCLSD